jgi:hypothetical protein
MNGAINASGQRVFFSIIIPRRQLPAATIFNAEKRLMNQGEMIRFEFISGASYRQTFTGGFTPLKPTQ